MPESTRTAAFFYGGFDKSIPALGTPFDGTYYLTQSGTPEKPIVIKAAGDGEVIFDGDGCQNLFNLLAGNYNYFEGITVRNTNVAFMLGIKRIIAGKRLHAEARRIYDVGEVVQDDWSGSKNFYIADNVFIGRHDPEQAYELVPPACMVEVPGFSRPDHIRVCSQGLRTRSRCRLQLRGQLARRH